MATYEERVLALAASDDVAEQRLAYHAIQRRSGLEPAEFNAEVKKQLWKARRQSPKTPADWLRAALCVSTECDKCRGTGQYSWGPIINGKQAKSGPCPQCGADGRMSASARRRTDFYWMNRQVA